MVLIESDCFNTLNKTLLSYSAKEKPSGKMNGLDIKAEALHYLFDILILTDNKEKVSILHFNKDDSVKSVTSYVSGKSANLGFGLLSKTGAIKVTYIPFCGGDVLLSHNHPKFWADYARKEGMTALLYLLPCEYECFTDSRVTFSNMKKCASIALENDLSVMIIPVPQTDIDDKVILLKKSDSGVNTFIYSIVHNKELETELASVDDMCVIGKFISNFNKILECSEQEDGEKRLGLT
ncbi:Uncharacterised protein [Candidatus Tiddalikarchaeum anstoanum]|nr:Uncharacterised protein [Candidatus Tiddalikarchaeum anstoanum]